jgi:methylglutamate dehydrogenase subunit B
MRIPCPHCGPRGHEEFDYLGDAAPRRPTDGGAAPTADWERYVYIRANPAGLHRELWYHGAGCQCWLVVARDTRTHEVLGATDARAAALDRTG